MFTIEYLRFIMDYCPETGVFTYKITRGSARAGRVAGTPKDGGYHYLCIDRKFYPAHRIAWAYVHGEMPPSDKVVDHINGDPSDNRIANLRVCTQAQNLFNAKASARNITGSKGVTWEPVAKCWRLQMRLDSKFVHVGLYDDLTEARRVRDRLARIFHGDYARAA